MPVNGAAIAPQFPASREGAGSRPKTGSGAVWAAAPVPPRDATTGAVQGAGGAAAPAPSGGGASPVPKAASTPAASPPGPAIDRLVSDVRAMLIQSQGAASGTATSAAGPAAGEKNLAADIQDLMSRMGSAAGPAKMPGGHGNTASGPHGHHHTGHGGHAHTASSAETAAAAAGGGGGAGRTVSTVLAGDIARAIRAYGGGAAAAAAPAPATV